MTRFEVLLTEDAERDLEEIHTYVAERESPARAARLLDRLVELAEGLEKLPDRGSVPKELLALGTREYRQVLLGPYRVIYRIWDTRVVIYLIVDGRRDMQALLARRLLRA